MSIPDRIHPVLGGQIAVWLANDVPSRIVYNGVRYRVTDTPTRVEDDMAGMAHPLPISGWRFQGTDARKRSLMFDICRDGANWKLMRVYE